MAVSYVGIDTQGARALGQVLQDTAGQVEGVRRNVSAALDLADLASQVPAQLALVQDGFARLAAGVTDKAALAERYVMDPQGTAAGLGAPVDTLGAAISGLLGFAGPADLRAVLVGLPLPGANPALDAALARLNPVLLPAFQTGQRPELTEAQVADLELLALALGIEHAGPPIAAIAPFIGDLDFGRGILGNMLGKLRLGQPGRTGTEVFWNDFWAGGRTVDNVLADPDLLLEWVAGTFELDRRLALATGLPSLGDILTSVDFATRASDPGQLAAILAAAETEFAAIASWLPSFLVGQDRTGPDATQLAQTLAFAARVGWPDPGPGAASEQDRFADAIAFLRANRALQSALLPTGFEGDGDPLAFFNGPGIGFVLDLGLRTGLLDATAFGAIASTVDQAMASFGVDLSGPVPATLTEQFQQQLFALLGTQIPRSALETPAIQAQFIAALGYLRAASTGPEQRQRLIEVLAAFRTLTVVGAPALTERQLVAAVGGQVLDVLGRSRLRLRSQNAVRKNPEFLLVARQWGLPGSRKEEIGKYKFSWSFDDLGMLTGIRRKKKSWLSRAWDTVKAVGKAIWESWEDNPLKAIFQVGKIALGALAFVVPGLQGLGAAALAVNLAETAFHAIEGDWLAAISSGLAAFTAGATDVFRAGVLPTIVETAQGEFVSSLLDAGTLSFLKDAKRAFDIGSSIFRFTQADSLVGAIGAGLGAVATTLGSGGQLLRSFNLADEALVRDLTQLGLSVADMNRLVAPAAGLASGGSVLASFGNGLALLAAGARVLSNPDGAFAGREPVAGAIFQFDQQTQVDLAAIAKGAGAAAGVARAMDAANRGDTFLAGTFLAQAVQAINDPRTSVSGSRIQAAERVAEIGVLLEAVFEKRASAAAVAPLVVQRLTSVFDSLNTRPPRQSAPPTERPAPTPAPTRTLDVPAGIVLGQGPFGSAPTTALGPLSTTGFPAAEAFMALGDGSGGLGPAASEANPALNNAPFGEPMRLGARSLLQPAGDAEAGQITDSTSGLVIPAVTGTTVQGSQGFAAFTGTPELVLTGLNSPVDFQSLTGTGLVPLGALTGGDETGGGIPLMQTASTTGGMRPLVRIAVIGNSYTAGLGGDLGTYETVDVYVPELGATIPMIHPAYRSSQAAAMQVIDQLRAQHPGVDFEVRFVAVSGATPDTIRYSFPHTGTPFEARPQVEAAGAQFNIPAEHWVSMADVVLLGEGGNPHFTDVVRTVMRPGNSYTPEVAEELLNRLNDRFRREQDELQGDILYRMNPQGTLIVMGYPKVLPDVMPGLTEVWNPFSPAWAPYSGAAVYTEEAQTVNTFGFMLNWELEGSVNRTSAAYGRTVHFVNPWNAFEGQEFTRPNPAIHGVDVNPETLWYRSFHPTPEGYRLLAGALAPIFIPAVESVIARQSPPDPSGLGRRGEAEPIPGDGQPTPIQLTGVTGEYDGLMVPAGIALHTGALHTGSYVDGNWVSSFTGGLADAGLTGGITDLGFTGGLPDFSTANLFTGGLPDFNAANGFTGAIADFNTANLFTGGLPDFNAANLFGSDGASFTTADILAAGAAEFTTADYAMDWSADYSYG